MLAPAAYLLVSRGSPISPLSAQHIPGSFGVVPCLVDFLVALSLFSPPPSGVRWVCVVVPGSVSALCSHPVSGLLAPALNKPALCWLLISSCFRSSQYLNNPPPSLRSAFSLPPCLSVYPSMSALFASCQTPATHNPPKGVQDPSRQRDGHDLRTGHVLLRRVLPRHHCRHRGKPAHTAEGLSTAALSPRALTIRCDEFLRLRGADGVWGKSMGLGNDRCHGCESVMNRGSSPGQVPSDLYPSTSFCFSFCVPFAMIQLLSHSNHLLLSSLERSHVRPKDRSANTHPSSALLHLSPL